MESVSKEHGDQIRDMIEYLGAGGLTQFELLIVHKDLIGMALEAQVSDQSLEQVLGMEGKRFCDQILEQADSPDRVVKFLMVVKNLAAMFGMMVLLSSVFLFSDRFISFSGSSLTALLIFGICYILIEVTLMPRLVFYKKIKNFIVPVFFLFGCLIAAVYRYQTHNTLEVWFRIDTALIILLLAVIWAVATLLFYFLVNKDAKKYHWMG